jgi:hypothetical protein
MTAVSFQMYRGVDGFKMSDVTVGTNAPAAEDIELRFNLLDQNGNQLTQKDVVIALEAFRRWAMTSSGSVGGNLVVAITNAISAPPG